MTETAFGEEQIIPIFKEIEAGTTVGETHSTHDISEPTYYVRANKFVGMEVSQLRYLKNAEAELAQRKRL